MSILKCKICGGDLNVHEGSVICRCEYCGTAQTIPISGNEKKTNLFNRANRLRMNADFDKASAVYTSILAEFPKEAEAYWGLCLCKYGIEYVDDPLTAEKVPTCHRTLVKSILDDEDYLHAVEFADSSARSLYISEAKRIDGLQQRILRIVKSEAPYDVFICYKETDDNGDRTQDSVLAYDIYDALTARGLRVFFARISLEDKIGQEYEPYIYAALQSARVMLLVCTSFENMDAAWVKNEWLRFIDLMKTDRTKALVPCYKGFEIDEMPKLLQRLQCQDLSKLGWMQDLTRGVLKICQQESRGPERHNIGATLEKKDEPECIDERLVQSGHFEDRLRNAPVLAVTQDEGVESNEIKTTNPQNESVRPEISVEQTKSTKKRIPAGRVFATLFHMLSIMIVAIIPHGFSPQNMTLVGIDIFCALILPVFVWKADKKKSTKRILLDSLLCYIAIVLAALAYTRKMNMYVSIACIWVFIVLNVIF